LADSREGQVDQAEVDYPAFFTYVEEEAPDEIQASVAEVWM
jgi:hypothetical protein